MRNRVYLKASSIDEHGAGVGVAAGRTVHAAGLLPGETGWVELEHESPHALAAWGNLVQRDGAEAPERVAPACSNVGQCGGCAWQPLAYDAQLSWKRHRVENALRDVTTRPVMPVRPAAPTVGYRAKAKYVVGGNRYRPQLGAYAPRTHDFVPMLGCRVVEPVLDEVAAWLEAALRQAEAAPYDERKRTGDIRYAVLRANRDGDVLVGLVMAPAARPDAATIVADSLRAHPAVRGVVTMVNAKTSGVIVPTDATVKTIWGEAELTEQLLGVPVKLGISAFTQAHPAAADALYRAVADIVAPQEGMRALDLFAGLGGHSFALAQRGAVVSAVETHEPAVTALNRAARSANLSVEAVVGDAAAASLWGAEVIVVNPPRKGLGANLCQHLIESEAQQFIYVSCNPESLARDLGQLASGGLSVQRIEPFDLMPGTGHVETLVQLRRV